MEKIGLVLSMSLVLAACSGGEVAQSTTSTVSTTATTEVVTTSSTLASTATSVDSESAYWQIVQDERVYLAGAVEKALSEVETVDRIEIDPEGRVIAMSVTSVFSGKEARTALAWDLMRSLVRTFYSTTTDEGRIASQVAGLWKSWGGPMIELVVDDLSVSCDTEFLQEMAELLVDRSDWEATCIAGGGA